MTQLFVIHSAYGLATVAAAIDAGLIPATAERILVAVNSARVPETAPDLATEPSLASLRARFDRVYALADILGAIHPSGWEPEETDLPMLERLFGLAWHVDPHDVHLFVQSPQVAPAKTLMALFGNAEITIVGDGLMTYSPMRIPLPHTILGRITGVVYADVVTGVTPLVASPGAAAIPVPPAAFAAALQETAGEVEPFGEHKTVVVLGQYLAALGLITAAEELELQRRMIERAVQFSPARIIFRPHPAAPPHASDTLAAVAERAGIEFVTYTGTLAAELLAQATQATTVVAGFSTTLPTVAALYDTPIAAVGLTEVLAALKPYENSNRIPAVIVDALTRDETPYATPAALQELVDAVGYVMQPLNAAHVRQRAERFLARAPEAERARYFDPQRLLALRLPGAPTQTAVQRFLHPAGGIGHIEELKLTAIGARNRLARTWRVLRGRP